MHTTADNVIPMINKIFIGFLPIFFQDLKKGAMDVTYPIIIRKNIVVQFSNPFFFI